MDMRPAGGKSGDVCGLLDDGVCVMSSEGEKLSGLPWREEYDGESLGLERSFEDAFLRTGRIQGGRDVNGSPMS